MSRDLERAELKRLGKELLKSNRGWAMPLAIMIVLVTALLSGALFAYAMADMKAVKMDETREKARYMARSGAEAVIKKWMADPLSSKPTGNIDQVSLLKSGEYKRTLDLTATEKNSVVGTVDVNVATNADGSSKFTSKGVIEGISQTVAVTSSRYQSGSALGWYYNSGEIKPGKNNETVTVDTIFRKNYTATIRYHDPAGVVETGNELNAPGTLYLDDNENNNKVAFSAQSMFINNALNLRQPFGSHGALATSAGIIDFKGTVYINCSALDLGVRYGTLVLHVPKEYGIKLTGKSGEYGKVYFENKVILRKHFLLWEDDYTIIDAGSAYYFKRRLNSGGKEIGVDLVNWYYNKDDYKDDFIEMLPGDPNAVKPDPKDKIFFIWD